MIRVEWWRGTMTAAILVSAIAGTAALPAAQAFAQAPAASDEFKDEFSEFTQKLRETPSGAPVAEAAGETPPPEPASPVPQAPTPQPQASALPQAIPQAPAEQAVSPVHQFAQQQQQPQQPQQPNPLGIAATLPMDGNLSGGAMTPMTPAELQAQMEEETALQAEKLKQQTFDAALNQLLPLQPEQIRRTLDVFRDSREAAETPITVPEPVQEVVTATLDPGDAPIAVLMSPNHVTTVTIVDATGAPWPIQDVSWAGGYTVTPPEEGGHVLRITPTSAHGVGNISIRLVDMITPLTMRLQSAIDRVHYRLDVRVAKNGPLAKTPLIEYGGLKAVAGRDDQMVSVLDGTPPAGAERLKVDGVDGRTSAWRLNDRIYLRTPLTLLSPGWDASVSSADGMNVYTLANAPVILLSDRGRMLRASIAASNGVSP